MAQRLHVHPNLMGSAGSKAAFEQGHTGETLCYLETRQGRTSGRHHGHARAMSRFTVLAWSCRTSSVCARKVLATTRSPLVFLSSRCTMPARGIAANCGERCKSALSSVPFQLPLPG